MSKARERSFSALGEIGQEETEKSSPANSILPATDKSLKSFPVSRIKLGDNIREVKTDEALKELARSIEAEGLLQPVVLSPEMDGDGNYKLLFGHRRFKAVTEILKRDTIRAILHSSPANQKEPQTEKEKLRAKLSPAQLRTLTQAEENEQRENISDSELARHYQGLKDSLKITTEELALLVNKSLSYVKKKLAHAKAEEELKKGSSLANQEFLNRIKTEIMNETATLPPAQRIKLIEDSLQLGWTREILRAKVSELKSKEPAKGQFGVSENKFSETKKESSPANQDLEKEYLRKKTNKAQMLYLEKLKGDRLELAKKEDLLLSQISNIQDKLAGVSKQKYTLEKFIKNKQPSWTPSEPKK